VPGPELGDQLWWALTPNQRFERTARIVFVKPRRESMIEIKQLRLIATHPLELNLIVRCYYT